MYLSGNRAVVIIGALIGIPAAKLLMDAVFPMFVANVACLSFGFIMGKAEMICKKIQI